MTSLRFEVLLQVHPLPGEPGDYGQFETGTAVSGQSDDPVYKFKFGKMTRMSKDDPFEIVRTRGEMDMSPLTFVHQNHFSDDF